ncbi:MAG: ABC transporter ATP-binding protein, partial [Gammaproteobacteria bacterium]|nr:ABC transporter ATP-binding protein [Gammaproteobacteria bacterium]
MFHAAITYQRENFSLNAELSLDNGSITALVGASGSGKSSLFRLLSGLEIPSGGEIYSDNTCWFDKRKKINLAIQKRKVGMVFQDYALFEHLSVYDNIAYGVEEAVQQTVVIDWLNRINLSHKATAYPQELSGGEKQRVALARALVIAPDILLLDEPFSALDIFLRHELRRELQKIISYTQIPVLIATHDLEEARFLADTVYVLSEGRIIQHGPVSE